MARKTFAIEARKSGLLYHNLSKIQHLLLSLKQNQILVWRNLPLSTVLDFHPKRRLHVILTFVFCIHILFVVFHHCNYYFYLYILYIVHFSWPKLAFIIAMYFYQPTFKICDRHAICVRLAYNSRTIRVPVAYDSRTIRRLLTAHLQFVCDFLAKDSHFKL